MNAFDVKSCTNRKGTSGGEGPRARMCGTGRARKGGRDMGPYIEIVFKDGKIHGEGWKISTNTSPPDASARAAISSSQGAAVYRNQQRTLENCLVIGENPTPHPGPLHHKHMHTWSPAHTPSPSTGRGEGWKWGHRNVCKMREMCTDGCTNTVRRTS